MKKIVITTFCAAVIGLSFNSCRDTETKKEVIIEKKVEPAPTKREGALEKAGRAIDNAAQEVKEAGKAVDSAAKQVGGDDN